MNRKIVVSVFVLCLLCFAFSSVAIGQTKPKINEPDTLIKATTNSVETLNPQFMLSTATMELAFNVYNSLLDHPRGDYGVLIPGLATKVPSEKNGLIKIAKDGTTAISFPLRSGVKFHNGNPFNAADVKFTFERLSNPDVSEFINTGKSIDAIEILGDHTVVIKTKEPIPWFANNMHQIFMMDKESTEARDQGDVMVKPIGTGAYKLEEWARGSYVRMVANEE